MSDLDPGALSAVLGSRPFRTYPALLSTGADAQAWARGGAPDGAVVVADYQVSPRGRAGLPWQTAPGVSLCFSMVVRPHLPTEEEGWLYLAALLGLGDAVGADHELWWPDEVRAGGRRVGAVGVDSELDGEGVTWAVLNVFVDDPGPDRGGLLARVTQAIEARLVQPHEKVANDVAARCATLGRRVRARMIPLGPAGPVAEGVARTCLADGALAITTASGVGVAVRPQHLGLLDLVDEDDGSGDGDGPGWGG